LNRSRKIWTAIAVFTAIMTVAEVIAIHAAVQDAKQWLSGNEGRAVRQATTTVARVVRENILSNPSECTGIRMEALPQAEWDAVVTGASRELPRVQRVRHLKWSVIALES